jgi:hypothetical protein
MVRDTVGLALAGVLAGLAAMLFVASIAVQPFLVVFAIPFAAGAYLVWQASIGEYGARGVSGSEARRARARRARAANDRAASDGYRGTTAGERRRSRNYERARAAGRRASGRERAREEPDTLARREAARVLGVDADAEPAAVRSAYRERVKEVHPDTEGGDAEAFQQVNDAYERLQEE